MRGGWEVLEEEGRVRLPRDEGGSSPAAVFGDTDLFFCFLKGGPSSQGGSIDQRWQTQGSSR